MHVHTYTPSNAPLRLTILPNQWLPSRTGDFISREDEAGELA